MVTVESILKHGPCWKLDDGEYDVAAIREVVGDGIPLLDFLHKAGTGRLTHTDAVWYVTKPGVLDADVLAEWIDLIVTRAITYDALETPIDERAKAWLNSKDRSAAWASWAAWAAEVWAAWAAAVWFGYEYLEERKQQVADLMAILERKNKA